MKKKIGILNTSILTCEGDYKLRQITLNEARDLIKNNEFVSAIGHKSTAEILTTLLEEKIEENRINFVQDVGQKCLVFKLLGRPEEGKILTIDDIINIGYKFQLLERLK